MYLSFSLLISDPYAKQHHAGYINIDRKPFYSLLLRILLPQPI